jgi:hypothetical protein
MAEGSCSTFWGFGGNFLEITLPVIFLVIMTYFLDELLG